MASGREGAKGQEVTCGPSALQKTEISREKGVQEGNREWKRLTTSW